MAKSLQDQLLKSGLAKPKQAKNARREKAKKNKAARHSGQRPQEEQVRQQQAAAAEVARRERDRKLAAQRNAERQAHELDNTVTQIIRHNRIDNPQDDVAYRYTIEKTVRTVDVSHAQRNDLAVGRIGIACHQGRGSLVPRSVAERLMEKIPGRVWLVSQHDEPEDLDDPYADFKVPDDLMW